MVDMAGSYTTKGRAERTHDYEIKERYGDTGRDQQINKSRMLELVASPHKSVGSEYSGIPVNPQHKV